jgi:hypothetical protein
MSKNRERKDQKEQRKCESHPGWLGRRSLLALAIVSAVPASARAQTAGLTRPGLGAKPPVAVAVAPITQEQVESFATVVGEDPYIVAQVLAYNPDLVPVTTAATEARDKRRRLGRGLIIGGFSALGIGIGAGLLVALSGPWFCFDGQDQECRQEQDRASSTGGVIAIAGAAVGLALALPGFIANARESDIEVEAIRRYRGRRFEPTPAPPREPARFPAVGYAPRSVNLPLLSLTF